MANLAPLKGSPTERVALLSTTLGAVTIVATSVLTTATLVLVYLDPCRSDCHGIGIAFILLWGLSIAGLAAFQVGRSLAFSQSTQFARVTRGIVLAASAWHLVASAIGFWFFAIVLAPVAWFVWRTMLRDDAVLTASSLRVRGRFFLLPVVAFCFGFSAMGIAAHMVPYTQMIPVLAYLLLLGTTLLITFLGLQHVRLQGPDIRFGFARRQSAVALGTLLFWVTVWWWWSFFRNLNPAADRTSIFVLLPIAIFILALIPMHPGRTRQLRAGTAIALSCCAVALAIVPALALAGMFLLLACLMAVAAMIGYPELTSVASPQEAEPRTDRSGSPCDVQRDQGLHRL